MLARRGYYQVNFINFSKMPTIALRWKAIACWKSTPVKRFYIAAQYCA
jgi:hypothetical protein